MSRDDQGREVRSVTIRSCQPLHSGFSFGAPTVVDTATGEPIKGIVQSIKIKARNDDWTFAEVTFGGVVLDDIKVAAYYHVQCPCGHKIALAEAPKSTGEIVALRGNEAFPVAIAEK